MPIRRLNRRGRLAVSPIEFLESRLLLAAHIVGNSTVYSTIQAAVNAASAGATITVDPGTYAEEVTISKSLTIKGAQAGVDARLSSRLNGSASEESIVSGTVGNGVHSPSFYIAANDVTVSGFTVESESNPSASISAGIVIAPNHAGTHILYNIVQDNVSGLFLANDSSTDAAIIQYNYFRSNNNAGDNGGRGIYTDQSIFGSVLTNVTIDSNTFLSNDGGAGTTHLEAACAFESTVAGEQSNIRITNNVMTSNGKAVLFFNTTGVVIEGNTVTATNDKYSGSLRFEGNNQNVTIDGNAVYNNYGPAVAVDSKGVPGDSSGFVVNGNNFYNNNRGFSLRISVAYNAGSYDGVFNAENNWWGISSGPSGNGPGSGDAVSAGAYDPSMGWGLLSGGDTLFSPWSTSAHTIAGTTPTPPPATAVPAAPSALSAIAQSSKLVTLTWKDNAAGNETGFIIQRSSDDKTFTTIGTTATGVTTYSNNATFTVGAKYYYQVLAKNSVGDSKASTAASVVIPSAAAAPVTTNLSTLSWTSATVGYGTIHKNASVNGNPINLRGTVYSSGIGTHAVSQIVYALNGKYTSFLSDVGIDNEITAEKAIGSVDFKVIGDGKVLFDSGVVTNASPVVHINVSVAGVKQLTLLASNGIAGSIDYDHADWAGARLLSQPAVPTAPSGLAAVAISSSQIKLSWKNTTTNQTAIAIDRSTNGTTFTTIATNVAPGATSYTDFSRSAGTKYYYRIRAVNAAGSSANTAVVNITTLAANVTATYLSNLTPISATTGWGPVQKDKSVGGHTITLRGTKYTKGVGTDAVSDIVYALAGKYSTFISDVGIDDEENGVGIGSVDFQVIGDGKVLFNSGVLTNASPIVNISVSVVGVKTLTLVANNGVPGSISYDHADWAGARVL